MTASSRKRAIHHLANVALVVGSVFVALLIGEVLLRIVWPANRPTGSRWFAGGVHPRFMVEERPGSDYALRPGFRGVSESPDGHFEVDVVIDDQGLRDHVHAPGDQVRVLMVGNSITFGQGVESESAYPAGVEALLRREQCRVFNAGVPGFSTRQMYEQIEKYVPLVEPDLITVAFNPIWDRERLERPFVYFDGFIVKSEWPTEIVRIGDTLYGPDVNLPVLGALTMYAQGHSRVYQVLRGGAQTLVRFLRQFSQSEDRQRYDPEDFAAVLDSVLRLQRLSTELDVPLLVIILEGRTPAREELIAELARRARRHGVRVDTIDELLPEGDWTAWSIPNDGHWNEAGHEAVAEKLAPVIRAALETRASAAGPN